MFTLPLSPDELWASFRTAQKGKDSTPLDMSHPKRPNHSLYNDIEVIAPMVIYLGYKKYPVQLVRPPEKPEKVHLYTCKHLGAKTNNCTIYEHRPLMCRDYPYRSFCNYNACTWTSRKQKPETKKEKAARLAEENLTKFLGGKK